MRGAQSQFRGGGKIVAVRGHHHAFARLEIERRAGGEIDARLRLEVMRDLGAEDRVPRKIIAAGEIDHQRDIAVRHRRQPELALEPRQRGRHVRPSIEPMPHQRQIVEHFVRQVLQTEARQQAFEVAPVQHVELGEGLPAGAHFLHTGLVFAAPGVGESQPIELVSEQFEDFFRFPGDRLAPVHHRPEHVEKQGADHCWRGVHAAPFGRPAVPFRAAATGSKSLIKWRERRDSNPRPLP